MIPYRMIFAVPAFFCSGLLAAQSLTFNVYAGSRRGPGMSDGPAAAARLLAPMSVVRDGTGNLYIADAGNQVIRKVFPDGRMTTLAGTAGALGAADGIGAAARFNAPWGMVRAANGDLLVADSGNHTIRRVTPAGVVSTIAGLAGVSGAVDGPGSAARFYSPEGLALDGAGNLFVAEEFNCLIRKIDPAGNVTTVAGQPRTCSERDGAVPFARFSYPRGVAVAADGTLFVADGGGYTIRTIAVDGTVTTLAGLAYTFGAADGTGANARFNGPDSLALAADGKLYVTDLLNDAIRAVTLAGDVSTCAGILGRAGSNDGPGANAHFFLPRGVWADPAGGLLVADAFNGAIRAVSADCSVTTLAGQAAEQGSTDGPRLDARFSGSSGMAADAAGTLFVADANTHVIRKIASDGSVTTVAGLADNPGTANGNGSTARFNSPLGVAVDGAGNLFVADSGNHAIRKITPAGDVTTLAGLPGTSGYWDAAGTLARFYFPTDLALDSAGNLLVADAFNNMIRRVTSAGAVTTYAGSTTSGSTDGTGTNARFYSPRGVAIDAAGTLYVADSMNNTIRKVASGGVVTTLAGKARVGGFLDGTGANARFNWPNALAIDGAGDVWVADMYNNLLRKVTAAGIVTTPAGSPTLAGCTEGTGADARFWQPSGLVFNAARDKLYVTNGVCAGILVGTGALADRAAIDSPTGMVGAVRQLDSMPQTAGAWTWSQTRIPAASLAALSDPAIRNPTFIPDACDAYQFLLAADQGAPNSISRVGLSTGSLAISATTAGVQTLCVGGAGLSLSVTAAGAPDAPAYQWYREGVPIVGATGSTYAVAAPTAADSGRYFCRVNQSCGSLDSEPVTVLFSTAIPAGVTGPFLVRKGSAQLIFAWTNAPDAASYTVYRDTAASGTFATVVGVAPSGSPGLPVTTPSGSPIFFRLSASNACGEGPK